ncbi:MAG TPA: DUF4412 domain-containing protein, partial [Saprospiraceae bacterium]|nr:DUF4412 domain-containing protein [Saprospiraceae bacterium]
MEMKMWYKGKKSRMEQSMGMMGTTITINDGGAYAHQLSESMMGKTYVKIPVDSLNKEDKSEKDREYKITYTEETKTIAGYECKKAVIEFKTKTGDTQKSDVWYTEKLPRTGGGSNKRMEMFKDLKGRPLKWSMVQGPVTINIEATEVNTNPVPDSKFTVDATGYTEMSYADYMEQMKAMGQGQ